MASIMTKRGSQDNIVTYEIFCDTMEDRDAIAPEYCTLGTAAIVLKGVGGGVEVYIAGSDGQWHDMNSNDVQA